MAKLALLLLIVGGLVLFAFQNLAPISLVILGIRTIAFPLAFWVLGAIAAGAFTTLIVAALVSLSRPKVAARRVADRAANAFSADSNPGAGSNRIPWTAPWTGQKEPAPTSTSGYTSTTRASSAAATSNRSSLEDDWETGGCREEWDDWEETPARSQPRASSSSRSQYRPQPEVRDTADDDWANWEGYEEVGRSPMPEPEPVDRTSAQAPPQRTDFEIRQEPATRQQIGSIYSYSYRKSEELGEEKAEGRGQRAEQEEETKDRGQGEEEQGKEDQGKGKAEGRRQRVEGRTGGVYDAEYRVITPPYRPDPEDFVEPAPSVAPVEVEDDEDWGLDDEPEDWNDRNRKP